MTTTIVLSAALPAGTYTLSPVGAVVTPPPPPPTTGTFWIYHAGVLNSPGDYDFGSGSVAYNVPDPAAGGELSAVVTGDEGMQIRMPGDNFDPKGYRFLLVSIKPTQAGDNWTTGAEEIGDVPIPGTSGMVSIMPYGPNPVTPGQYGNYKIPLSALGINDAPNIYKIAFLSKSANAANNSYRVKDIGFSPT
jgi:hypothetical protein